MGGLEERDPAKAAAALDGRPWYRDTTAKGGERVKLPKEDVFEVPASLTLVAVRMLEGDAGAVPLTEVDARWLAGGRYECPEDKKPYLIRAVYVARGSGDPLEVERVGENQILVGQVLFGYTGHAILKTALIVNVDFDVTFVGTGVIFMG